jgi:hypothetical protein
MDERTDKNDHLHNHFQGKIHSPFHLHKKYNLFHSSDNYFVDNKRFRAEEVTLSFLFSVTSIFFLSFILPQHTVYNYVLFIFIMFQYKIPISISVDIDGASLRSRATGA